MYPLRLALCADCGLVQIDEEAPPEQLFADYIYVTGTSDRIHAHARFLRRRLARQCGLREGDLVLELASNDGTVLRAFQPLGVRTVGFEPAANIAERANQEGVETRCAFFGAAAAAEFRQERGAARLILARHVLAHVNDLHGFVRGLRTALADDGLAVVEVPHLAPFYTALQYDTVYHEHLCYFSVEVLRSLFESERLELVDVVEVDLHGGSILVSAQKQGGPRRPTDAVDRIILREKRLGLGSLDTWRQFAGRVARNKIGLVEEIDRLRATGRTIAGYGAPAKGMTLLAFCGIGPDHVPYLVDRSPYKQGLLTPGHHIPVLSPERLLQDQPDVILLLAWNFADEIVKQQAEYLRRGGAFLVPIPEPHYWDQNKKVPEIGAAA
jgi:SAM-dependent methyltransferase